MKSNRRGGEYRLGQGRAARNRRRLRQRARRMQRQLANRTESRIGADLRDYFAVAGNRTFMKMSDANQLRDKDQRRAEYRDRARDRPAAFMNLG